MPLPVVLLAVVLASCLGFALARSILVPRHRRDLTLREREMTAAVQERFAAYLALEAKVRRMLERLDMIELETADGLARTGSRLRDLDSALAACAGLPTSEAALLSEDMAAEQPTALDWMDAIDEESSQAVPVLLERDTPAAAATFEEWEGRLEVFAAEKRAEIERQERVIADLTARLQEARATQTSEEHEAANDVNVAAALRHEAAVWRERHMALEIESAAAIAAVRARAEQAGELEVARAALAAELASLEKELAEARATFEMERERLEGRLSETEARHAAFAEELRGEVAELEARVLELEPYVERERAATAELEHWRRSCERLREEQGALERAHDDSQAALAAELAETRERLERELAGLEASRLEEVRDLTERIDALAALRPELESACTRVQELGAALAQSEDEVAALEAELGQAERRGEEARGELEHLGAGLEQAQRDVAEWRAQAHRAGAERDARVREMDARLDELESLSEMLRTATELHLGRIAELEGHERELQDALLERTESLTSSQSRLEQAERTLETVSRLLRESHSRS